MDDHGYCGTENPDVSALMRVSGLPVVASAMSAVTAYYISAKSAYPTVAPYLEAAENATKTAATIAISTAQPVVEKYGPRVNSYANMGIDKLENAVPLIHSQPDELYSATKSAVSTMVNSKINKVLKTTDDYVDYFLPDQEQDIFTKFEDDSSDTESEDSFEDEITFTDNVERITTMSNKVRTRAYKRAFNKISNIRKRSDDALQKLNFTVNLIQYAKENVDSTRDRVVETVSNANGILLDTVDTSQQFVGNIWNTIKTRTNQSTAEMRILARARILTKNIQDNCTVIMSSLHAGQGNLRAQVIHAREIAGNMIQSLNSKRSFSELSSAVATTMQAEMIAIQQLLASVLDNMAESQMFDWMKNSLMWNTTDASVDKNEEADSDSSSYDEN